MTKVSVRCQLRSVACSREGDGSIQFRITRSHASRPGLAIQFGSRGRGVAAGEEERRSGVPQSFDRGSRLPGPIGQGSVPGSLSCPIPMPMHALIFACCGLCACHAHLISCDASSVYAWDISRQGRSCRSLGSACSCRPCVAVCRRLYASVSALL